jgi:hypothetical protein
MSSLAPPSSQAAGERPIAFLLTDDTGAQLAEPITLSVRPEALTRQDPSRLSVQQTLGGAWADSFGAGLATINISGHTGWRRNVGSSPDSSGQDGVDRFLALRETVFQRWHDEREQRAKAGLDPSGVQLIFSDALDRFGCVVAPQGFTLQRSRSRPLLMQYQISMVVLSDSIGFQAVDASFGALSGDVLQAAGLESLSNTISKIEGLSKSVTGFLDSTIGGPVKQFMATTAAIYKKVDSAVRSAEGVASSLIGIAQNASRAGMNLFRSIGQIVSLPQRAKALLGQVAAAYTNAFCLMRNAVRRLPQYDDYTDLYGASNCSSTSGGRGLSVFAGVSTLAAIAPAIAAALVLLTTAAQSSLSALARADVVLTPPTSTSLISTLKSINLGMSVSP